MPEVTSRRSAVVLDPIGHAIGLWLMLFLGKVGADWMMYGLTLGALAWIVWPVIILTGHRKLEPLLALFASFFLALPMFGLVVVLAKGSIYGFAP